MDLLCFLMLSGDLDVLFPFEQLLIHWQPSCLLSWWWVYCICSDLDLLLVFEQLFCTWCPWWCCCFISSPFINCPQGVGDLLWLFDIFLPSSLQYHFNSSVLLPFMGGLDVLLLLDILYYFLCNLCLSS